MRKPLSGRPGPERQKRTAVLDCYITYSNAHTGQQAIPKQVRRRQVDDRDGEAWSVEGRVKGGEGNSHGASVIVGRRREGCAK